MAKRKIIVIPDPQSGLVGLQVDEGAPVVALNPETTCNLIDALLIAVEAVHAYNLTQKAPVPEGPMPKDKD